MAYTKQTHCKHGHELTEANVYWSRRASGKMQRQCRVCRTAERREAEKKIAAMTPVARENRRKRFPSYVKMKHYQRKYRYGITESEYRKLIHEQDGLCMVCATEGAVELDHDHETGKVRGILCGSCNRALGLFRDDAEALDAAADYIRRWSTWQAF